MQQYEAWLQRQLWICEQVYLKAAAKGDTIGALVGYLTGTFRHSSAVDVAARNGHLRTVIWLTTFGCSFDLVSCLYNPDTSCLRWLLQFKQHQDLSFYLDAAVVCVNYQAVRVLLNYTTKHPFHTFIREQYVDDSAGFIHCLSLLAKVGRAPPWPQQSFTTAQRAVALVRQIPSARASIVQRWRAVRTIQNAWLRAFYTPGYRVWKKRLERHLLSWPV